MTSNESGKAVRGHSALAIPARPPVRPVKLYHLSLYCYYYYYC